MTTTTFKNVGGTSKPAKKPADPDTITIKGEGTIPVYADGAMRRLPKGEPVKVSAAELAFLKRSKVDLA
ncbi:MAG: hypothetical protein E5V63_04140 [Mesorhizobium sp.]|nr:MAG: hypothetical protein E5V63_04140 [Mesorhizobium sp.]